MNADIVIVSVLAAAIVLVIETTVLIGLRIVYAKHIRAQYTQQKGREWSYRRKRGIR